MLRGLKRLGVRILGDRSWLGGRSASGIGALLVFASIFAALSAGATSSNAGSAMTFVEAGGVILHLHAGPIVDATDTGSSGIVLEGATGPQGTDVTHVDAFWRGPRGNLRKLVLSILRHDLERVRPHLSEWVIGAGPGHSGFERFRGKAWSHIHERPGSAVVPEPSTAGLLGLGLALLASRKSLSRRGFSISC